MAAGNACIYTKTFRNTSKYISAISKFLASENFDLLLFKNSKIQGLVFIFARVHIYIKHETRNVAHIQISMHEFSLHAVCSIGLGRSQGDSDWITALVELGSGYSKVLGMAEPN